MPASSISEPCRNLLSTVAGLVMLPHPRAGPSAPPDRRPNRGEFTQNGT